MASVHTKLIQLQDIAEETAIKELENIDVTDPERAHDSADEALLTFIKASGFGEVSDAYDHLIERIGCWGA